MMEQATSDAPVLIPLDWQVESYTEGGLGHIYTNGRFAKEGAEILIRRVPQQHQPFFLDVLERCLDRKLTHGEILTFTPRHGWIVCIHDKKRSKAFLQSHLFRVKKGALVIELVPDGCYLEHVGSKLLMLRRLADGSANAVDTRDGVMLQGGLGVERKDMNFNNDAPQNIHYVSEKFARAKLLCMGDALKVNEKELADFRKVRPIPVWPTVATSASASLTAEEERGQPKLRGTFAEGDPSRAAPILGFGTGARFAFNPEEEAPR